MKKLCSSPTCDHKQPQDIECFTKNKRYKGGYTRWCKSCQKKYCADRYMKQRSKILQQCREYYASNIEKARAKRAMWRAMNKKYARDYGINYRKANPGKELAKTRKYSLAKINRTPQWLSVEQIRKMTKIYETCPYGYEVDHIVPLQGKNVSGLHVPWNLQHLPKEANRKKSNKY